MNLNGCSFLERSYSVTARSTLDKDVIWFSSKIKSIDPSRLVRSKSKSCKLCVGRLLIWDE